MKKLAFLIMIVFIIGALSPSPSLAKRDNNWWKTTNNIISTMERHERDRARIKAEREREQKRLERERLRQEAETERLRIRTEAELEKERIRRGISSRPAPRAEQAPVVIRVKAPNHKQTGKVVCVTLQPLMDGTVAAHHKGKVIGNFQNMEDAVNILIAFFEGDKVKFKIVE